MTVIFKSRTIKLKKMGEIMSRNNSKKSRNKTNNHNELNLIYKRNDRIKNLMEEVKRRKGEKKNENN